jgi:hypothetical protein
MDELFEKVGEKVSLSPKAKEDAYKIGGETIK